MGLGAHSDKNQEETKELEETKGKKERKRRQKIEWNTGIDISSLFDFFLTQMFPSPVCSSLPCPSRLRPSQ